MRLRIINIHMLVQVVVFTLTAAERSFPGIEQMKRRFAGVASSSN
jgi:hypothetical protein